MKDISYKTSVLQTAKAVAFVLCSKQTIEKLQADVVLSSNLFNAARSAAFLGAKASPQLIARCHSVNIDSMYVSFDLLNESKASESGFVKGNFAIAISAEVKTVGRAAVTVQALTGVSLAAVEIYDQLQSCDVGLEIAGIKLLPEKTAKGGELKTESLAPSCAILVCSNAIAEGKREDKSGALLRSRLINANADLVDYEVIPDDKNLIQAKIQEWVTAQIQFVFTTGGTGLGPRDNTVAAVREILERDADGITEAMRAHGQMRSPMAMMSRAVAGSIGQTLVITMPGSSDGLRDSLDAILPAVFHARKMMKGGGH